MEYKEDTPTDCLVTRQGPYVRQESLMVETFDGAFDGA